MSIVLLLAVGAVVVWAMLIDTRSVLVESIAPLLPAKLDESHQEHDSLRPAWPQAIVPIVSPPGLFGRV